MVKWPSVGMRVGLELQLEGALCGSWSLHQSLQKQEIFRCEWNSQKLWHVELDGTDIEYVTEPYELGKDELIEHCIISILEANKKLEEVVQRERVNEGGSIGDWYRRFYDSSTGMGFSVSALPFFEKVIGNEIRQIPDWKSRWQPQLTVQHPLRKTITLCSLLFSGSVISKFVEDALPKEEIFSRESSIAGFVFLHSHELQGVKNSFDYPLNKDTAFLTHVATAVCKVFLEKNPPDATGVTVDNLKDLLKDRATVELVNNPQIGYVISNPIYALFRPELGKYYSLSNSKQSKDILENLQSHRDKHIDSLLLMHRTLQDYNFAHQFDAKRWTHFMSRRPFSMMYRDIIEYPDDESTKALKYYKSYTDLFNKSVKVASFSLPTNYAEQFYDVNGNIINLERLGNYFPAELQGDLMSEILKNGLLSSHMLSCIDVNKAVADKIFSKSLAGVISLMGNNEAFYREVLTTVESPKEKCFLNIEKKQETDIRLDIVHRGICDFMSPLFPLDLDDAMGRYRESSDHYNVSAYGSAIVEFRSIQYVKNPQHEGENVFLTDPLFLQIDLKHLMNLLGSL